MAKLKYQTTILVDTGHHTIHCCTMLGGDASTIEHRIKNYTGTAIDEAFFACFGEALAEFAAAAPSESMRRASLILPDEFVSLGSVNVPTMRSRSATKRALDLTLAGLYRNIGDLKLESCISAQNRQYTTFSTAAVQKRLLTSFFAACSKNRLLVDTTTYAAGSTVGAASILNPKLKNAAYLFLDIKDTYSRFIFAVNGRAVGFYRLPFGLEALNTPSCLQEDMLMDHRKAETLIMNTVRKARPPRRLHDSMQRTLPDTHEGMVCANFRIFMKWALSLLMSNERITQLGRPECVYVNIPEDLSYVIDYANTEREENSIEFRRFGCGADFHPAALANLELYGGFFPDAIHAPGRF